jgi:glycosyltransferase involved in cell wall biosynthesis
VGNIANNAYLNALALNQAGLDCDVLCADYYHIMGCPEWESAEILGPWGDDFNPNWSAACHGTFTRPRWFAQGPLPLAVAYLDARRSGRAANAEAQWRVLESYRWLRARPPLHELASRVQGAALAYRTVLRHAARVGPARVADAAWRLGPVAFTRRAALGVHRRLVRRPASRHTPVEAVVCREEPLAAAVPVRDGFELMAERLCGEFHGLFPGRPDSLAVGEIVPYRATVEQFRRLSRHYDVVHTYGASAGDALLSGLRPYVSYEHGTLRSIPFEPTTVGRLTALAFRLADRVLITNPDVRQSAERLGITQFAFVPHPVNEAGIDEIDGRALRAELLARKNADFVVFHPSRQHWSEARDRSLEKGNDIFLRGFARFVHEVAPRAMLVLARWGGTIGETERLLAASGLEGRVHWVPPQPHRSFVRYVKASDAVADQFYLGTFGSLTPKVMACRRIPLVAFSDDVHAWCFPEMPPVVNARTDADVFAGLTKIYRDPAWREAREAACRAWYDRYHSLGEVVHRLRVTYEDLLDARDASRRVGDLAGGR